MPAIWFYRFNLVTPKHRLRESLMSNLERFQNVVLGGGEAGKYIAWEFARSGQRVAVVEKALIRFDPCPRLLLVARCAGHERRERSGQPEMTPVMPRGCGCICNWRRSPRHGRVAV